MAPFMVFVIHGRKPGSQELAGRMRSLGSLRPAPYGEAHRARRRQGSSPALSAASLSTVNRRLEELGGPKTFPRARSLTARRSHALFLILSVSQGGRVGNLCPEPRGSVAMFFEPRSKGLKAIQRRVGGSKAIANISASFETLEPRQWFFRDFSGRVAAA